MIIVDIWHWVPFVFLILFAAVEGAAGGASSRRRASTARRRWQTFGASRCRCCAPAHRRRVSCSARILAFKAFDEVFLLTSGGPGTSTELISLHLYKVFFEQNQLGYGALLSLAVIAAIVAFLLVARALDGGVQGDEAATPSRTAAVAPPVAARGSATGSCWPARSLFVVGPFAVDPDVLVQVPDRHLHRRLDRSSRRSSNYADVLFSRRSDFAREHREQRRRSPRSARSLVLVVGTLAAYSLHRFRWARWVSAAFLGWTLVFHMIPVLTLIGPWYIAFRQLGLYDTRAALVLTHVTINLPMTIWLMMAFFREIPPELEEAALVDGCDAARRRSGGQPAARRCPA